MKSGRGAQRHSGTKLHAAGRLIRRPADARTFVFQLGNAGSQIQGFNSAGGTDIGSQQFQRTHHRRLGDTWRVIATRHKVSEVCCPPPLKVRCPDVPPDGIAPAMRENSLSNLFVPSCRPAHSGHLKALYPHAWVQSVSPKQGSGPNRAY